MVTASGSYSLYMTTRKPGEHAACCHPVACPYPRTTTVENVGNPEPLPPEAQLTECGRSRLMYLLAGLPFSFAQGLSVG